MSALHDFSWLADKTQSGITWGKEIQHKNLIAVVLIAGGVSSDSCRSME